jgi:hypothetical protein
MKDSDFLEELNYIFAPTDNHKEIVKHMQEYIHNVDIWMRKGFDTRALAARKNLIALHKLSKSRRAEIQNERNESASRP